MDDLNQVAAVSAYERAIAAIAEAVSADEVMGIRDEAERMRVYARQAKNRQMIADAMEIQLRAERALGGMLIAAKEAGQMGRGGAFNAKNGDGTFQGGTFRLAEVGVDRKLSMRAQQLAGADDVSFADMLGRARDKIVSGGAIVVNPFKDLTTQGKKDRRAEREVELARKLQAMPDKRYGVIYADPEWRFEPRSRETGMDRAADNHYPTSELEEIKARDVAGIAADDCVLFLWATAPMLPQALEVMAAWGFEYITHMIWRKLYPGSQTGTGYWFRGVHELLLVGRRGDIPAPAMGEQWASVKPADVGDHSEKPDIFRQMIEQYYPNLPKIELNARRTAKGWDLWGYEAPEDDATESAAPVLDTAKPLYAALIAAALPKFTRETAAPIMRERYGSEGAKGLAPVLDRPVGTIKRWALELGLSDRERLKDTANFARQHVGAKS